MKYANAGNWQINKVKWAVKENLRQCWMRWPIDWKHRG